MTSAIAIQIEQKFAEQCNAFAAGNWPEPSVANLVDEFLVDHLRERFIKEDPRSPQCDFCSLCGTMWTRGEPENHDGPVPGMTSCLLRLGKMRRSYTEDAP